MATRVAVVGVQGDVAQHVAAMERALREHGVASASTGGEGGEATDAGSERSDGDAEVLAVREAGVVPDCDVCVLPGGESTTISRLLARTGIDAELREHVAAGRPLLATCAGLIVASRDAADDRVEPLDLVDATVRRNAFGRQRDSFEADLDVAGLAAPFRAVFIRAPVVASVGEGVDVLATWDGRPVAVRDGPVLGTAFHPELTDDTRVHALALRAGRAAVH